MGATVTASGKEVTMRTERTPASTLAVFVVLVLCTLTALSPAGCTIITVPDDHPTIQGAIDASLSGDTIHIRLGVYAVSQTIQLPQGRSLEGEGPCNTIIEAVYPLNLPPPPDNDPIIRARSHTSIRYLRIQKGGGAAIHARDATNVTVFRNVIVGCDSGVYLDNYGPGGEASVLNNTVVSCRVGIADNDWGTIHMYNNIVVDCYYGIYRYNVNTWFWQYNDVCGNVYDWYRRYQGPFPAPPGNLCADPLFRNGAAGDYRPTASSPCINAGHPDPSYNDPDGSRNDIGALPYGACNDPPVADAGDNILIVSAEQGLTIINGGASDPDGDTLEFRWRESEEVLLDWSLVGPAGEAHLDLAPLPYFSVGNHTLTLEVRETGEGGLSASDQTVLTIQNSPPDAQPAPSYQVVEIGIDPIIVVADVSDFDGDTLTYEWLKGAEVLDSGSVETVIGGDTFPLPDLNVPAGEPRFPVGVHQIELRVNDGVNEPVSAFVSVEVTDTTAPSLSPVPSVTILWPPNHQLVPVTIWANAFDNGGGTIHLDVEVASSEPPDTDGDGNTIPDWYIDSVDDETGVIQLRLRSERSGKGDGRIYTISIRATDEIGNESVAIVEILAPHDKRKK